MKYDAFFTVVPRHKGRHKEAMILKSERYLEFLREIMRDESISLEERLFITCLAGCGARVSELLSLKKKDLLDNKHFYITVLKKDHALLKKGEQEPPRPKTPRLCKIPEAALEAFHEFIKSRKPHEYIFRFDPIKNHKDKSRRRRERVIRRGKVFYYVRARHTALYRLKQIFGKAIENHSFRHGYIAYLMYCQKTAVQIANTVEIDLKTVQSYIHTTNIRSELASTGI